MSVVSAANANQNIVGQSYNTYNPNNIPQPKGAIAVDKKVDPQLYEALKNLAAEKSESVTPDGVRLDFTVPEKQRNLRRCPHCGLDRSNAMKDSTVPSILYPGRFQRYCEACDRFYEPPAATEKEREQAVAIVKSMTGIIAGAIGQAAPEGPGGFAKVADVIEIMNSVGDQMPMLEKNLKASTHMLAASKGWGATAVQTSPWGTANGQAMPAAMTQNIINGFTQNGGFNGMFGASTQGMQQQQMVGGSANGGNPFYGTQPGQPAAPTNTLGANI